MLNFISTYNNLNFNFSDGSIRFGRMSLNIYDGIISLVEIIITIILMKLIVKIGCYVIEKAIKKHSNSIFSSNEKKSKTICALLKSILRYSVYFFGIIVIINISFGNVISNISIAFASIGGVAIGLATQNIVKDIINGFLILIEDQYSVGEYINIEEKGGIVEGVELRVTKIRDFNGDLYIIPNSLIAKVTNHSRGAIKINVEVKIDYEEDVDKAMKTIEIACEKFVKDNKDVIESPKVLGITNFGSDGTTIKVSGKVKPMTQWANENELKRLIKIQMDLCNIMIPGTKIEIIK